MLDTHPGLREKHIIGPRARERNVGHALCPAFAQYDMELAGMSDVTGDFEFVKPCPRFSQVVVCRAGSGLVWVGNAWLECSEGMAFITPAGILHAYHAVDGRHWSICWVIYFDRDPAHPTIAADRPKVLDVEPQPFVAAVAGLCREFSGRADPQALAMWTSLTHFYAQRIIQPATMDSRLERLWEVVSSDLTKGWAIEDLASLAGMSREHLRRLCHWHFGRSPIRQLAHLRMQHAATLLSATPLSIEMIAERVGYDNAYAFSTSFRRHMGVAPSRYRSAQGVSGH